MLLIAEQVLRAELSAKQGNIEAGIAHAERAVRLKPDSTKALKALAFVYSAQNQLQPAQALYEKALVIQPSSWRVAVNLGELALINNDLNRAIDLFEQHIIL